MISNAAFQRKIIYGVLIAGLLIPLYVISRPSMRESDGSLTEGGVLSRMRAKHDLSQANLGEIDPASESMKLATLGMKGIAANILWNRANRYKREHDWDNLSATLNQISKLQPNFISVWQFQGWNLAYNVSVEFDDYRSRYHWVRPGINYLRDGTRYNTREPVLFWEIGWTFGHKIGKADEYVQFRRLFRGDTDFHEELAADIPIDNARGPTNEPDNWLVGREWFRRAEQIVESGVDIRGRLLGDNATVKRGKTPLIFHSHAPKWLISYAVAIEEEGYLDERAKVAFIKAGRGWNEYGNRDILTSYGFAIRLNDGELKRREAADIREQLFQLVPGIKDEILAEKKKGVSAEMLEALEIPWQNRTFHQNELARVADRRLRISFDEIEQHANAKNRKEIARLARKGKAAEAMSDAIDNYRQQVNYLYWKLRCEVEQQDTAILARRHLFDADEAYRNTDLEGMRSSYELAWDEWARVFERYPQLMEDSTGEDLMDAINRYSWLLSQLEEEFPPPGFKLTALVAAHDPNFNPNAPVAPQPKSNNAEPKAEDTEDSAEDTPAEEPADSAAQEEPAEDTTREEEPDMPSDS